MSMAKKISKLLGEQALTAYQSGDDTELATAVRYSLQLIAAKAPGHSVELRVPPFGATQLIDGTTHRRGTPPNVVECDARTFLALADGSLGWSEAVATGKLIASGNRVLELSEQLPLFN